MNPDTIKNLIVSVLPDARVDVKDMNGGGDHWEVEVSSQAFMNKSLIEQHRMIYQALEEPLKGPIHALKLKTIPVEKS